MLFALTTFGQSEKPFVYHIKEGHIEFTLSQEGKANEVLVAGNFDQWGKSDDWHMPLYPSSTTWRLRKPLTSVFTRSNNFMNSLLK
jgi:hypothetical protein